jgi:hypothetical protein
MKQEMVAYFTLNITDILRYFSDSRSRISKNKPHNRIIFDRLREFTGLITLPGMKA